jgi:hypothetical protein
VLWGLGYPEQALVHSQEALTQAQRLSNPYILMWCQSLVANLHVLRGEATAARQLAEASVALATTLEAPFWGARSTFMRGIALTRQGVAVEGLEQMQAGWAAIQTMGVQLNRVYFLARLAEALLHAGQPDAGLPVLAEALAFIHTSGSAGGKRNAIVSGGSAYSPSKSPNTRLERWWHVFSTRLISPDTNTARSWNCVLHELEPPVAAAGKYEEVGSYWQEGLWLVHRGL